MPAYLHHHQIELASILCPGCLGVLPMYVRHVDPDWSNEKIDIIYECPECGAEVRQTVGRPRLIH